MDELRIIGMKRVRLTRRIEEKIGTERGLWYESPEEIAAGLRRGELRAVLLRWVERQMLARLDPRERRCVGLYYLEGRTYREVAALMETTPPCVMRLLRKAVKKLRRAAARANLPEGAEWRKRSRRR